MDMIWQDAHLKNIDLRADAQKQQALRNHFDGGRRHRDETKILQQMDRVSAARSRLGKSRGSEHLGNATQYYTGPRSTVDRLHANHAPHRNAVNYAPPRPLGRK